MSSKRQSSISWVKSVLTKRSRRHFLPVGECVIIKLDTLNELLEQAKQLHEQEIKQTFFDATKFCEAHFWLEDNEIKTANEYYQDTYGE